MTFIEWTNDMSVGRATLDHHHRMILDCLNRLHPLLGTTGQDDEIRSVLETLEDFVLVHFSEEERVMRAIGYPDWRQHKLQHDAMYDMVFELKVELGHGRVPAAEQLFTGLGDWLVRHILGEDRKYMPYLECAVPAAVAEWQRANGRPY